MRLLDEHCRAVARDPASLRRSVVIRWGGSIDETCRRAELYHQAGFSELILMVNADGEAARRLAEVLTTQILPLRALAGGVLMNGSPTA